MAFPGKLGRDEGHHVGPPAGDGAVLAGQGGNSDMEGTRGDELPDYFGQAKKDESDKTRKGTDREPKV